MVGNLRLLNEITVNSNLLYLQTKDRRLYKHSACLWMPGLERSCLCVLLCSVGSVGMRVTVYSLVPVPSTGRLFIK